MLGACSSVYRDQPSHSNNTPLHNKCDAATKQQSLTTSRRSSWIPSRRPLLDWHVQLLPVLVGRGLLSLNVRLLSGFLTAFSARRGPKHRCRTVTPTASNGSNRQMQSRPRKRASDSSSFSVFEDLSRLQEHETRLCFQPVSLLMRLSGVLMY